MLAKVAALSLGLTELDWDGAVRIAYADDALRKYNPNEPRDWRGRWITDASPPPPGAPPRTDAAPPPPAWTPDPKDWVHLPPGRRIDELGDFLEWIANSTPEEVAEIRREIKRLYYDVGDITGADALNRAASDAFFAGSDRLERQAILDRYEPYTRQDPAEVGQALRDVASLTLLLPPEVAAEIATITGETATVAEAKVWTLGWAKRGQVIEDALGRNLPRYFRAIDWFGEDGIAVSIKSIDLNGVTYQNFNRLSYRLNQYGDGVADFVGDPLAECPILPEQIKGRELWIAIPPNTLTGAR